LSFLDVTILASKMTTPFYLLALKPQLLLLLESLFCLRAMKFEFKAQISFLEALLSALFDQQPAKSVGLECSIVVFALWSGQLSFVLLVCSLGSLK